MLATVAAQRRSPPLEVPVDEWLLGVIESAGYAGLMLLMIVEHLIPVIPSELTFVVVRCFVRRHRAHHAAA